MNKKRFFAVTLLVVFLTGVLLYLFSSSYAITGFEDLDFNAYLFDEVEELQEAASEYITQSGSTSTVTELCFQYIRKGRYNDAKWNALLGAIDGDFVDYVDENYTIDLEDDDVIDDLSTHKDVDFVHLMAVLNVYYKYGDTASMSGMSVSSDYSGWAGDLLTFLSEMYTYRTTHDVVNDTYQEYASMMLGTSTDSSFNSADMYADLDALNIYKDSTNSLNNLANALRSYYDLKDTNYNYSNRVASARNSIGSDEAAIKSRADTLLKNTLVQNMLIPQTAGHFEDIDYTVVEQAFADYIMGKSLILVQYDSISGDVGEVLEVEMVEANLDSPKITMTEDICEVEIYNDFIYILPKKAGSTVITIKSENETASVDIAVTATNVAPAITKDLDNEYKFANGVDSTINISATGTNNIYTWYIGDSKDGEFTKLGETTIGKYTFKPKLDMDNKYIKVEIVNQGNDKVTSKVALLRVGNASVGDIVETGDLKLMIGILFIMIAFVLNIGFYTVRASKINE